MPRLSTHQGLQDSRLQGPCMPLVVPTTISTAGPVTLTPAQILGGFILRDCSGAARTDTMPTAALLAEAIQGVMVGSSFDLDIRNISGGAFAVTVAAGTGVTMSPSSTTVAQSNARTYMLVFTNVTVGQEAYTVYAGPTGAF